LCKRAGWVRLRYLTTRGPPKPGYDVTLFADLRSLYSELLSFVKKLWWVVILLAVPAIGQSSLTDHWFIWQSMPLMLGWMLISFASKLVVIYVLFRFLSLQGDAKGAVSFDAASLRTFAPFAVVLVGWPLLYGYLSDPTGWVLASGVIELAFAVLLSPWAVSSPSGRNRISLLDSVRASAPKSLRSIAFLISAVMPIAVLKTILSDAVIKSDFQASHIIAHEIRVFFGTVEGLIALASMYFIARHVGLRCEPV
jgi:hypothetical protein